MVQKKLGKDASIKEVNQRYKISHDSIKAGNFRGEAASGIDAVLDTLKHHNKIEQIHYSHHIRSHLLTNNIPEGAGKDMLSLDYYGNDYYTYANSKCPIGSYYSSQFGRLFTELGVTPNSDLMKTHRELTFDSITEPKSSIPHITHHVWTTNIHNPKSISKVNIDITLQTIEKFDSSWKHLFWTNSLDSVPQEFKNNPKIEVRLISDLSDKKVLVQIDLLANSKYFAIAASDLARALIVKEVGGVYLDLDYKVCKPINDIINSHDSVFGVDSSEELYMGNAFIAAHKEHPILQEVISQIMLNFNCKTQPVFLEKSCNVFSHVIMASGPLVLTNAFYKAAHIDGNKDISFPYGYIFDYNKAAQAYNGQIPKIEEKDYCSYLSKESYGNDKFGGSWANLPEHWDGQWFLEHRSEVMGDIGLNCQNVQHV